MAPTKAISNAPIMKPTWTHFRTACQSLNGAANEDDLRRKYGVTRRQRVSKWRLSLTVSTEERRTKRGESQGHSNIEAQNDETRHHKIRNSSGQRARTRLSQRRP